MPWRRNILQFIASVGRHSNKWRPWCSVQHKQKRTLSHVGSKWIILCNRFFKFEKTTSLCCECGSDKSITWYLVARTEAEPEKFSECSVTNNQGFKCSWTFQAHCLKTREARRRGDHDEDLKLFKLLNMQTSFQ